jgi:hypothetical protein
MEVTLFPSVNELMLGQSSNAISPIVVTLSGMAREIKDWEKEKLEFPRVMTPYGMMTVPTFPDGLSMTMVIPLSYRTPSTLA